MTNNRQEILKIKGGFYSLYSTVFFINFLTTFEIINKNFSKIAPYWFELISSWLIRSYNVFQDIDKFIILIYFIDKDLIFYRKNGLVINYDTFYKDKSIRNPLDEYKFDVHR